MTPLIAFSVSNSPDLDRLGLFERSLKLTVSALATALIRSGARVAYGGNLDRSGFTYSLYPAVAEAYRSLASQTGRPAFVHFVARYQWQESPEIIEHIKLVSGFAEVCLVDGQGGVRSVRSKNRAFVVETGVKETRVETVEQLAPVLLDAPRTSEGDAADLTAMRHTMEKAVAGRVLIGGQVSGYRGTMPGVIEEAQNTLDAGHLLVALGGFGGAARDVAIALGLLLADQRIAHVQIGPGYEESLMAIGRYADAYQGWAREIGIWEGLQAAARAEDPEQVSRHVARVWAPLQEILARHEPVASR
jgi:hypothetical protein